MPNIEQAIKVLKESVNIDDFAELHRIIAQALVELEKSDKNT